MIHQFRETYSVGGIQSDLFFNPDMSLLDMLLQQRHTIPGNTNAPEDLGLTTAVASGNIHFGRSWIRVKSGLPMKSWRELNNSIKIYNAHIIKH